MGGGGAHSSTKYSKLENQLDSPEHVQFVKDSSKIQTNLITEQNDQLELIADSIGTLKHMSLQINAELDEQDECVFVSYSIFYSIDAISTDFRYFAEC